MKPTKKVVPYKISESPIEFYISEATAEYGEKNPFSVYYDNPGVNP
ncbi:MAG: hypothetical protein Q8K68_06630 [Nitrospirota bacterium]|nr:hypothetical protein [Nitrospirota bacterium]